MNKDKYLKHIDELLVDLKHRRKKKFKWSKLYSFFSYSSIKLELAEMKYTITWKEIIKKLIYLLFFVFVLSHLSHLNILQTVLLMCIVLLLFPSMLKAEYKQIYEMERFEMVVSYIENIIPIFEAKPIIIYALNEVVDILEGEIQECVEKP